MMFLLPIARSSTQPRPNSFAATSQACAKSWEISSVITESLKPEAASARRHIAGTAATPRPNRNVRRDGMSTLRARERASGHANALSASGVHRAPIVQRHPAPGDAIDEPEADQHHRQPGNQDADAERADDEQHAERDPQQPEPERPDLPAE